MRVSKEKRKQHSMKWRMMGILLFCWLIPFAFMIGVLGVYLASNHSDMTARNFERQLEFNSKICVDRLNGAVAASRQASYDEEILNIRSQYLKGNNTYIQAYRRYQTYLKLTYQKNDAVSSAILWFDPENDRELYNTYNEQAGGVYQQIQNYQEKDHEAVAEYAETLGTKIGFLYRNGVLYLVRNLVDSHYVTQGVLVLCLNQEYCFNSLSSYPSGDGVHLMVNGQYIPLVNSERLEEWEAGRSIDEDAVSGWENGYTWEKDRLIVMDEQNGDNFKLHTVMLLQKEVTRFPFFGYQYVLGGIVASLIPMLLMMMYVFRRQVTDPVTVLSDGAKHIEEGDLGYQIQERPDNLEFAYLTDHFNQMSLHLKQQFDKIYQEEIALREARIMALQSHINPHFMNNTLEIINWEARLGGNLKVSKMIEALSTMLDAAMDRRKRPQVRLAEEMGYVNSYLYITRERLGKRLEVKNELTEDLMEYLVPRLILQPVIENAVEHGVVRKGRGTVVIRGWRDETYLYLETVNDGGLSPEDRERIGRLLAPGGSTGSVSSGNLGIANVNQRLRILFGEPCGLQITENDQNQVVAKLTILLQKWVKEDGEMNKTVQEMTR